MTTDDLSGLIERLLETGCKITDEAATALSTLKDQRDKLEERVRELQPGVTINYLDNFIQWGDWTEDDKARYVAWLERMPADHRAKSEPMPWADADNEQIAKEA